LIFAHDTECALVGVAALVNTLGDNGEEGLPDLAALDAFLKEHGWTGKRDRDAKELASVRALRAELRRYWELDEVGVVEHINTTLRDGGALPQLVKHDGWDYHLHATPPDAPLATRMAVEGAMAMLDVVRTKELSRLRRCELPGCTAVHVDLTKNRSRRFCDDLCGNRAAVAAYRARQAKAKAKATAKPKAKAKRRS
jgi:predicted RNA-binding Zn ribbon-like protein